MTEQDVQQTAPLPASMALAWGVAARPSRGPKRALTIDAIVAAGIAVAVEDGLAAVSMSRVAERVGVSTMALYRYVDSKDDLLEIMVDTALGAPPAPVMGETWRAGLRRWATGVRDAYRAGPWALRVPISAPPLGPNNVRWLERSLQVMRGTPLSAQQKVSVTLLLAGVVRSQELLAQDSLAAVRDGRDAAYPVHLMQLIDPVEFPEVSAIFAAGEPADDAGMDADFDFALERVLDGVEALMKQQRRRR